MIPVQLGLPVLLLAACYVSVYFYGKTVLKKHYKANNCYETDIDSSLQVELMHAELEITSSLAKLAVLQTGHRLNYATIISKSLRSAETRLLTCNKIIQENFYCSRISTASCHNAMDEIYTNIHDLLKLFQDIIPASERIQNMVSEIQCDNVCKTSSAKIGICETTQLNMEVQKLIHHLQNGALISQSISRQMKTLLLH